MLISVERNNVRKGLITCILNNVSHIDIGLDVIRSIVPEGITKLKLMAISSRWHPEKVINQCDGKAVEHKSQIEKSESSIWGGLL